MTEKRTPSLAEFERLLQIESDECVLWTMSVGSHGYGQVRTTPGANQVCVHRLALLRKVGPPPAGKPYATHACGVNRCMNVRHLRWETAKQNSADREAHGTVNRGARNGKVILTEEQVCEIDDALRAGKMQKTIAATYGVHPATVSCIATGENWGWLTGRQYGA